MPDPLPGRAPARPAHYADLLLHPINDRADASAPWMPGWELEHGPHRRFVLGGGTIFLNNAGLSPNRVAQYREDAIELLSELQASGTINWRAMPGMQSDPARHWREMARQQVNRVFNGEAVYLSKIMIVLLACELAVADLIRRKTVMPNVFPMYSITAPEDIYAFMGAIPACWNVNKFNTISLKALEAFDPNFLRSASKACGQRDDGDALRELADGHTVTFKTASDLHAFISASDVQLDPTTSPTVRATAGKYLGKKSAAPSEIIDRS